MSNTKTQEARVERVWTCKIGGVVGDMPNGADLPMRKAVFEAFEKMYGARAEFCFSGWGGTLAAAERAVVNNDDDAAITAIFAEGERNDRARTMSAFKAQIRNAITEIEEGDEDEAIATLKALIGETP
jgi:hypothetical protein